MLSEVQTDDEDVIRREIEEFALHEPLPKCGTCGEHVLLAEGVDGLTIYLGPHEETDD